MYHGYSHYVSYIQTGQDKSFCTDEIRMYVTAWVKAGGKLIITGKGHVLTVFNEWLGKTWAFEGDCYRRTQHILNRTAFTAIPELLSTTSSGFLLPIKCNAKACMLSNVTLLSDFIRLNLALYPFLWFLVSVEVKSIPNFVLRLLLRLDMAVYRPLAT